MQKEGRLTGTLIPANRPVDLVLAGLDIDGVNLQETAHWGNALLRSRDAWMAKNRNALRYAEANRLPKRPARGWR